jgi:hypothetical protein
MRKPKKQEKPLSDLTRSLTQFFPNHTIITGGIVPGVERQPLKKLAPDETGLLKLLERWRAEAEKAGHKIDRIAVAAVCALWPEENASSDVRREVWGDPIGSAVTTPSRTREFRSGHRGIVHGSLQRQQQRSLTRHRAALAHLAR